MRPRIAVAVTMGWLALMAIPAAAQVTSTSSSTSTTSSTSSTSTSTSTSTTSTTAVVVPLSKAEYVAQANDICVAGGQALAAVPEPETVDDFVPYLRQLVVTVQPYQDQLDALVPPPEDAEFLQTHLVDPHAHSIVLISEYADNVEVALAAGDIARVQELTNQLEAEGEKLAVHDPFLREYGLTQCAGPEEVIEARDTGETVSRSAATRTPVTPAANAPTTGGATLASTGRPLGRQAALGAWLVLVGMALVAAAHYRRQELQRWDLLPARARWRVACSAAVHRDPLPGRPTSGEHGRFVL